MDTIQISIKLNEKRLEKASYNDINHIGTYIANLESPAGHKYCDCLEVSRVGNIVVKISYPRYFKGINAYLVTSSKQCLIVQNDFCYELGKHELLRDAEISLNRVDIPFTYIMNRDYEFYSFKKVYQIFNFVYQRKNVRVDPKAYVDIAEFKAETLIYANAKSLGGYNSKITIYNQYKNLMAKTFNDIEVNNLLREYKGLKYRMRIEVSKRIQRKEFTIKEFGIFDIFGEYTESFKNYILENILDIEIIDKIYEELVYDLVDKLEAHRTFSRNFNYENFIYREIDNIYDYEILRRAVKKLNNNVKTRENAITAIRKVLLEYEREKGIIVMNTYEAILDIRKTIENSFQD